jgi:hypothetical protein
MAVSMINWNREHTQLRVKRNVVNRHGRVFFDDVEVGRIQAGPPRDTGSSGGESYTISSAAYGLQPPLIHVPQSSLTSLS